MENPSAVRRSSLISPDGRLPPLTPEAQKARAARIAYEREHPADSYLDRSPTDRCIMYHGVPPLPSGYNNTYQIFQTPGSSRFSTRTSTTSAWSRSTDDRRCLAGSGMEWRFARPVGGRHAGRRNDELQRQDAPEVRGIVEYAWHVERFTRVGSRPDRLPYTITDPTVFTSRSPSRSRCRAGPTSSTSMRATKAITP